MNVTNFVVSSAFVFFVSLPVVAAAQVPQDPEQIISEVTARPFAPEVVAAAAAEVVSAEAAPAASEDIGNVGESRALRNAEIGFVGSVAFDQISTYIFQRYYHNSMHETHFIMSHLDNYPITANLVGIAWYTMEGVAVHKLLAEGHPKLARTLHVPFLAHSHRRIATLVFAGSAVSHSAAAIDNVRTAMKSTPDSDFGKFSYRTTPVPAY